MGRENSHKEKRLGGDGMLYGTFEHNIDGKNRVFIPAEFREELGQSFVCTLCRSKTHPSIQIYRKKEYEEKSKNTSVIGNPHDFKTRDEKAALFLTANAASCDSHGRITLNPMLTRRSGITNKCVFVGFGDYIEVMSPEVYDSYIDKLIDDGEMYEQAFSQEAQLYREMTAEGKFIESSANSVGGVE